ncbi:hypothetical protein [Micromonospora avicenniae]|uniref:hypothetical protein n=1 Tax=Micromonospora avicenniae TaxID=1198245 RepID=UPI0033332034
MAIAEPAVQARAQLRSACPAGSWGLPVVLVLSPLLLLVVLGVPLQLLRAGVRLTSLVPPQALARVNVKLHESGVPIDLTQLKPEHIEDLIEHLDDLTVDLDDPSAKVQVFCE